MSRPHDNKEKQLEKESSWGCQQYTGGKDRENCSWGRHREYTARRQRDMISGQVDEGQIPRCFEHKVVGPGVQGCKEDGGESEQQEEHCTSRAGRKPRQQHLGCRVNLLRE